MLRPGIVMEMVEEYGQNPAKVVCLNILDIYERNEPELVRILEQKLYEHLMQEGLL